MSTVIIPVQFKADGEPVNPSLYAAVAGFCQREFRNAPPLDKLAKLWAVIEKPVEGSGFKVVGVGGMIQVVDVPFFHTTSERATLELYKRMAAFLVDAAGPGVAAFVNIEPTQEAKWKPFLDRIGAKPAHRWVLRCGTELEE